MSRLVTLSFAALVAGSLLTGLAEARDRYDRYGNDGSWARGYEDRRHDRRAGIVAGAIRADVAQANTERRYQECMRSSGYDYDCERQRYRDEEHARNAGRRAAIIVAGN